MIVEDKLKTNSVTISTGISNAAFFSSSLRNAPSRVYRTINTASTQRTCSYYLEGRAAIVDIRLTSAVMAKIELIFQVIHGEAGVMHDAYPWIKCEGGRRVDGRDAG